MTNRIVVRVKSEHPWVVQLSCCGRDDGAMSFATWPEADAFRESYTSGVAVHPHGYSAPEHESGHKRAAVIGLAATSPTVGSARSTAAEQSPQDASGPA